MKAQVGIIMGSDSDLPIMSEAAEILEELGVGVEVTVVSAHRTPHEATDYAQTARVSIVLFTKEGPEAGMQDLARAPSILLNALDCSQNFEITEGVRRGHYRADRPGG